jgi:hypothetical protein
MLTYISVRIKQAKQAIQANHLACFDGDDGVRGYAGLESTGTQKAVLDRPIVFGLRIILRKYLTTGTIGRSQVGPGIPMCRGQRSSKSKDELILKRSLAEHGNFFAFDSRTRI